MFTISIVVMSALGTMTMTTTMMAIFVGAEKYCAQSTRARGRVCALLPRRQGAWAADAGPGRPSRHSSSSVIRGTSCHFRRPQSHRPLLIRSRRGGQPTSVAAAVRQQSTKGDSGREGGGECRDRGLSECSVGDDGGGEGRGASAGGDVSAQGDGGSSEMDRLCSMVRESEREALERTLVYMKQEA